MDEQTKIWQIFKDKHIKFCIPGKAGVGMADEGLCATGRVGGTPSGLGGGLPLIYGGTGRLKSPFLGGGVTKIGA